MILDYRVSSINPKLKTRFCFCFFFLFYFLKYLLLKIDFKKKNLILKKTKKKNRIQYQGLLYIWPQKCYWDMNLMKSVMYIGFCAFSCSFSLFVCFCLFVFFFFVFFIFFFVFLFLFFFFFFFLVSKQKIVLELFCGRFSLDVNHFLNILFLFFLFFF